MVERCLEAFQVLVGSGDYNRAASVVGRRLCQVKSIRESLSSTFRLFSSNAV